MKAELCPQAATPRDVSIIPLSQSSLIPLFAHTYEWNYIEFPSFHLLLPTCSKELLQGWSRWAHARDEPKGAANTGWT